MYGVAELCKNAFVVNLPYSYTLYKYIKESGYICELVEMLLWTEPGCLATIHWYSLRLKHFSHATLVNRFHFPSGRARLMVPNALSRRRANCAALAHYDYSVNSDFFRCFVQAMDCGETVVRIPKKRMCGKVQPSLSVYIRYMGKNFSCNARISIHYSKMEFVKAFLTKVAVRIFDKA